MRRLPILLVLAGLLTFAPAAWAGAVVVTSTFDTDLDGWTVLGDPAPGSPLWQAAGGNPGGFAQTVDNNNGDEMYWTAPAKFLAGGPALLGGTLAFDRISNTVADETSGGDVVLTAQDGTSISWSAATLDVEPQLVWGRTSVPIAPGDGWTSSGAPATAAQFTQVLSALKTVQVAAEYTSAVDTDGLDNVSLTYTPVSLPSPSKAITLPAAKSCASRRSFAIRIHQIKRLVYASATVFVNGKTVKAARLTAPVNLTGLPKGTFVVKLVVKTSDGRTITGTRTYHTCAAKRRTGSGKHKL